MKSSLGDKQRILHMLECIDEINQATKELNREDFIRNSVVRIATVKWIEIIGEASVHITTSTKEKFVDVNWNEIRGLRNIVVHEYFGIQYNIIWEVVTEHLPKLKQQLIEILKKID